MSDEYGALTMVLLRFLAFPSSADVVPTAPAPAPLRDPAPARSAPLRAAAPPALSLPTAPTVAAVRSGPPPAIAAAARAAAPGAPAAAAVPPELGERWAGLVQRLCEQGQLTALVRELALQSGLRAIDDSATPPRWQLVVERESLRVPQLRDKLAAVLAAELGHALALDLEAGVPDDSPARREADARQRRQAAAEETIRNDPVVRELMTQFKSARIVPGSIKPV
jgi:DNA polymerase-3 subunit gamma/tau